MVCVLPTMTGAGVILVLLMLVRMVMLILLVLEGFGQVQLHRIPIVRSSVHHDIVALVMVALVEHSVCLRRLRPRRTRRRRSIGIER